MDSSYVGVDKNPTKVLIVYEDGSSEVFDNFVVIALNRSEAIPDIMEITMETIIKLPLDVSDKELLALTCSASDTIVRIVSGNSMRGED